MIAIDVADLVVIADRILGTRPGTALDQIDIAAAQAALAEARLADPDAGLAAATLIRALLRHPPFPSRGQQVAVAAGLQFLALNGWQADLDPPEAALVVIEGLASGLLSPADAAAWLSPRLSAYPASSAKEAPMRAPRPARRLFRAVDPRPRAGIHTPVTGLLEFTGDGGKAVVMARAEADRLGIDRPGPEQFLLALVDLDRGVAARALKRLGISSQAVRQQLAQLAAQPQPQPQPPVPAEPGIPFAMEVMPRAVGEAVANGRDYIGSEHILLALFHAGDDTAARALAGLGAGEHEVRAAIRVVTGDPGPLRPAKGRKSVPRDDEIRRLRREVARLRDLLYENGIEPGQGDRKSA